MSSHFELLAAVLVLVDRTKDRDDLLLGRERNRTGNCRVIALCGLNDLLSRLIDQGAVVAFQTNSDFFRSLVYNIGVDVRFMVKGCSTSLSGSAARRYAGNFHRSMSDI